MTSLAFVALCLPCPVLAVPCPARSCPVLAWPCPALPCPSMFAPALPLSFLPLSLMASNAVVAALYGDSPKTWLQKSTERAVLLLHCIFL